tara:strand:- start:486 stop:659 length:174 start_codon:yes stop_codon:yes gene_type:complete
MKKQKNTNGKGDKSRITDKKRFDDNWDKIFGIDTEVHDHPLGVGFAHKDVKRQEDDG